MALERISVSSMDKRENIISFYSYIFQGGLSVRTTVLRPFSYGDVNLLSLAKPRLLADMKVSDVVTVTTVIYNTAKISIV